MSNEKLKTLGFEDWLNHLDDENRKVEILEDLHKEDFRDFYGREIGVYEFQQEMGVCGILLPTGHFLKCHDRQHSLIASFLNEKEKFLSIYFSSRLMSNDDSRFSFHLDNNGSKFDLTSSRNRVLHSLNLSGRSDLDSKTLITQSQVDFISSHYQFMNQSQKEILSVRFLDMSEVPDSFPKELIADFNYILPI